MPLKHITRLFLLSLLAAWLADQLFWEKEPGISFFLYVLICLAAGLVLTWGEGLRPKLSSLLLFLPVMYFAGMSFLRTEPLTVFMNIALALAGLVVITLTWLGGRWWQYDLGDYVVNGLRLAGGVIAKPIQSLTGGGRVSAGDAQTESQPESSRRRVRPALSVLVGLALALPVVSLLGVLLSAADPIFAARMKDLLEFLNLDNLDELVARLIFIAVVAYSLSGVFLYALLSSRGEQASGDEAGLQPFMGWVEASTILTSVNLLFVFFVAVQFRYFFGGQKNINLEGFTYAEYARRGFGELVFVALISLGLFLGLSAITRRAERGQRRTFSTLGILLVGLVAVILVSAFQRLLLYEAVYGFTRLRTYTHVFMVWVGVLLLVTMALEVVGRQRYFALAAVLSVLGFGLSLNAINVDAWIARQNIARAVGGEELDASYLVSLSHDAVPAMVIDFEAGNLSQEETARLGAALACRKAMLTPEEDLPWQSFQWPREKARQLLASDGLALDAYFTYREEGEWKVRYQGEAHSCWGEPHLSGD